MLRGEQEITIERKAPLRVGPAGGRVPFWPGDSWVSGPSTCKWLHSPCCSPDLFSLFVMWWWQYLLASNFIVSFVNGLKITQPIKCLYSLWFRVISVSWSAHVSSASVWKSCGILVHCMSRQQWHKLEEHFLGARAKGCLIWTTPHLYNLLKKKHPKSISYWKEIL